MYLNLVSCWTKELRGANSSEECVKLASTPRPHGVQPQLLTPCPKREPHITVPTSRQVSVGKAEVEEDESEADEDQFTNLLMTK